MPAFAVAVIATRGRQRELARLLESLENVASLGAVIVVDNGAEAKVRDLVSKLSVTNLYLPTTENLGCGGGLAWGEKTALEKFGNQLTHIWILDDDAVVPPDIIVALTQEMERHHADAACPMIVNEKGEIGWFPGLIDSAKFRLIRESKLPAEFLTHCGAEPVPFSWSTGVSLLVTKRALAKLGPHRSDYWIRGEDLEFSLRITYRNKGIFVPAITVQHLPPTGLGGNGEIYRHAALLQNIAYTSLYLPHGRRILRTIPGNFLRFFRIWPASALVFAFRALWLGGIRAKPAGSESGRFFMTAFAKSGG